MRPGNKENQVLLYTSNY